MKIKCKIIILFLFAISIISVINAQEENAQEEQNKIPEDKRISIYLHPLTTIFNLISMYDKDMSDKEYYLYATVEVPVSSSQSLIIRPSYWDGTNFVKPGLLPIIGGYEGKRLGSDIGVRYYTSKKGKGSYLQGQTGLFYYKERKHYLSGGKFSGNDAVYMWFDVMGYIGSVRQFSTGSRLSFDFGLGYANIGGRSYPVIDITFGFGIKIGD